MYRYKDTTNYKRTPIINEQHRYEIIKSCRYVDEIIENAPLSVTKEFLEKNKIDIMAHGDDDSSTFIQQHKIPLELGIIRYLPYTVETSTTKIISKIKNTDL